MKRHTIIMRGLAFIFLVNLSLAGWIAVRANAQSTELSVARALTLAGVDSDEVTALELNDGERYLWESGTWYDVRGEAVDAALAAELTVLAATVDDPRSRRVALLEHMMGIGTQ